MLNAVWRATVYNMMPISESQLFPQHLVMYIIQDRQYRLPLHTPAQHHLEDACEVSSKLARGNTIRCQSKQPVLWLECGLELVMSTGWCCSLLIPQGCADASINTRARTLCPGVLLHGYRVRVGGASVCVVECQQAPDLPPVMNPTPTSLPSANARPSMFLPAPSTLPLLVSGYSIPFLSPPLSICCLTLNSPAVTSASAFPCWLFFPSPIV